MGLYAEKVIQKLLVLFIAMLAGFIAKKTRLIDGKSTKSLSSLLTYITNPCLIIASLQIGYDIKLLSDAGKVLMAGFLIMGSSAVLSTLIFKRVRSHADRSVYQYALTYSNCGFLGYPLLEAMFPENGLFFGVIYVIAYNVLAWTHGVAVMDNSPDHELDLKKVFLNPCLLSTIVSVILFITEIRLPGVILEGVDMVGDMTFPLSMIIIGSLLADKPLRSLFTDIRVVGFSLLKLIVMPLLFLGALYLASPFLGEKLSLICLTLSAVPAASLAAVLAELYGDNSALAAKIVGLTTLLSLFTLPLILMLAQKLLPF